MSLLTRGATAEPIAEVELPDSDGQARRMGSFWVDNPVVFVWLRHYG